MSNETGLVRDGSGRYFHARSIDDVPELLEKSYALRYQVYCLERKFLHAENYASRLEIDEFDRHAIHVGAVDVHDNLAGTARAIAISELGLPLFRHCTTFPQEMERCRENSRLVEVGRLSVSRAYRRRVGDGVCGGQITSPSDPLATHSQRRERPADVLITVLKALYQATRRIGATHWLAAMERSLERLLAQFGFPFRLLGPESNYLGLVSPYHMELVEFDHVIRSGRFPVLDSFMVGLESGSIPQSVDNRRVAPPTSPTLTRVVGTPRQSRLNRVEVTATSVFGLENDARLLRVFRQAAAHVPAYRTLLHEHGVQVDQVVDRPSFSRLCPLLSKHNTFNRFPLDQLSVGGMLLNLADVLTSSGHGGHFAFGVTSRKQALASARFMDQAFDKAFDVTSRRTLAINCLPMGVTFGSRRMAVATTSVREDMVVALVEAVGHHHDQIVLVGDPLFLKRLTDYASERGLEWSRYRVNAIIGEEVFGEHFRGYLAARLGMDIDHPEHGYVMSSFGVAELGLHLCYETPATIGVRRAAFANASFAQDLLGVGQDDGVPLPMIFSFDPSRTFIEIIEPNSHGYGRLATSMLDPERTVPLLRYQTGDIACLLGQGQVAAAARRHGVALTADLPGALVALRGRETEALPNGAHVAFYKDALYADPRIACHLTGAFRVIFSGAQCTMHVQAAASQPTTPAAFERGILRAIPARARPEKLVIWAHGQFPFGMGLDYERKFSYHEVDMPGAAKPATREIAS